MKDLIDSPRCFRPNGRFVSRVFPTTEELVALEPCPICEQLAREHSEASAELWDLNKRLGIGAQSRISIEEQESEGYKRETQLLRAAHERCAATRTALLKHRRDHGL